MIEKVSNNTYESEVRKRILIPLQMRDTYFEYRETKTTPNEFVETFFGNVNVTRNLNTSFDWAGGGYVTTTLDFKKFIKGLISNKLFKTFILFRYIKILQKVCKETDIVKRKLHCKSLF